MGNTLYERCATSTNCRLQKTTGTVHVKHLNMSAPLASVIITSTDGSKHIQAAKLEALGKRLLPLLVGALKLYAAGQPMNIALSPDVTITANLSKSAVSHFPNDVVEKWKANIDAATLSQEDAEAVLRVKVLDKYSVLAVDAWPERARKVLKDKPVAEGLAWFKAEYALPLLACEEDATEIESLERRFEGADRVPSKLRQARVGLTAKCTAAAVHVERLEHDVTALDNELKRVHSSRVAQVFVVGKIAHQIFNYVFEAEMRAALSGLEVGGVVVAALTVAQVDEYATELGVVVKRLKALKSYVGKERWLEFVVGGWVMRPYITSFHMSKNPVAYSDTFATAERLQQELKTTFSFTEGASKQMSDFHFVDAIVRKIRGVYIQPILRKFLGEAVFRSQYHTESGTDVGHSDLDAGTRTTMILQRQSGMKYGLPLHHADARITRKLQQDEHVTLLIQKHKTSHLAPRYSSSRK